MIPAKSPQYLINHRYAPGEELGRGAVGVVYRTYDRLTDQYIALKRLQMPVNKLSKQGGSSSVFNDENNQIALAREFRVLATLRHPYIISVLDYGFDENYPYYTMTLLDHADNLLDHASTRSNRDKIRLLGELLQALVYLHHRGIVHRDLKPGNILLNQAGHIQVCDFGLATHDGKDHQLVGTLAYMAPEILNNHPATIVSDLYAVGVMAYQMFAGQHPFQEAMSNIMSSIRIILSQKPDMTPIKKTAGKDMADILEQLLAKNPDNRYQRAADVMRDLYQLANLPLPAETQDIQRSFLETAPLTGRDTELRQLRHALNDALNGNGTAWLISGNAGMGKSRLLDEMAIRAKVKGAQVIHVQGSDQDGSRHHLWRDIIPHFLLTTAISPLEAAILSEIIPDIDRRLAMDYLPDVMELEPDEHRQRLEQVILFLFRRQTHQPVVLLLDDLHEVQGDIKTLRHLTHMVDRLSLLIVGTYAGDEAPYFYGRLPEMTHLSLDPLTEDEIRHLSQTILGEAGKLQPVVDLLTHHTEGNILFIVETLRTLAAEAGRLEDIGKVTLPQQILIPTSVKIVARRLDKLRPENLHLLRLAAVYGRTINGEMLNYLDPSRDVLEWLSDCANARILDFVDGEWQFIHDKVREGILHGLDPEQLQTIHGEIARTLATLYGDHPDIVEKRLYHVQQSDDPAAELPLIPLVVRHWLHNNMIDDRTLVLLERGLRLIDTVPLPEADNYRVSLLLLLIRVHRLRGDSARATRYYQDALDIAHTEHDLKLISRSLHDDPDSW